MPVLDHLHRFYQRRRRLIHLILTLLVLTGAGLYYYRVHYQEPREKVAYEQLSFCEQYFRVDSFQLALDGSGHHPGLQSILQEYEGTQAANLAHYYAGIIYLKQGRFQESIQHLSAFSTKSVAGRARREGLLGDAYGDLADIRQAVKHYLQAADLSQQDAEWGSACLFRAALLVEEKDSEQAIQLYKKIKRTYPYSRLASQVDKYLARLGAVTD